METSRSPFHGTTSGMIGPNTHELKTDLSIRADLVALVQKAVPRVRHCLAVQTAEAFHDMELVFCRHPTACFAGAPQGMQPD